MKNKLYYGLLFILIFLALLSGAAFGLSGNDIEKPKPEFKREEDKIIAKLIPRGKSTNVFINFETLGGKLIKVMGVDFDKAARPEVDIKNFKSALFMVEIGEVPAAESEVKLKISSKFFSSSTEYYIFNERLGKAWMNSQAENASLPSLLREITVTVKDGGDYDSDGAVNGKILIIGGPRDSFWGYALGTLLIRFWGIFIVLGFLMAGMILSGKIFQSLEKKKTPIEEELEEKPKPAQVKTENESSEMGNDSEIAAAIGAALHLHLTSILSPSLLSDKVTLSSAALDAWTQQGREQIMEERFLTFNRNKEN